MDITDFFVVKIYKTDKVNKIDSNNSFKRKVKTEGILIIQKGKIGGLLHPFFGN